MTTVYDARLAGIATAVGLTFDDLLGEMNQQPLCPLIPQFVKRPQQAQFEQRLQRTDRLGGRKVVLLRPGPDGLIAEEIQGISSASATCIKRPASVPFDPF